MARQPASNEEALVGLGSEKLASLVIGEAKRNAAFRKLFVTVLAATEGPAAAAAIIDRRLTGLDRAKAFVELGFDAEMGAGFLEGDFKLPAADEPGEDVARTGAKSR